MIKKSKSRKAIQKKSPEKIKTVYVDRPVYFIKRSKVDEEFEKKINLFTMIALVSIIAWLFTFLPLTHQLGENARLREEAKTTQEKFVSNMQQCQLDLTTEHTAKLKYIQYIEDHSQDCANNLLNRLNVTVEVKKVN